MFGVAHLSLGKTAEMERVTVKGAQILANVCAEVCPTRLVYFSSALAANPNDSSYARSKRQAFEDIILGAQDLRVAGVHVTILRPTNVYGRGMKCVVIAAMIGRPKTVASASAKTQQPPDTHFRQRHMSKLLCLPQQSHISQVRSLRLPTVRPIRRA